MLMVLLAVDCPNVMVAVALALPMVTTLLFVVPIRTEPPLPACIETAAPPVPPWIKVLLVAAVEPILTEVFEVAFVPIKMLLLTSPALPTFIV